MQRNMFYGIMVMLFAFSYCFAMNPQQILEPEVLEAVTAHHLDQEREYLAEHRSPLLILFSGCAGMGKTTTAQAIQCAHNVLRFDAFSTRVFLRSEFSLYHEDLPAEEKLSKILVCFTHFLSKVQKNIPNKTVIFDESIDRQDPKPALFERMQAIAQAHEFPLFIIRLQVPREIACNRLMKREAHNDHNIEHFKARFDMYYDLYEAFDASHVHYLLDNSADTAELLSPHHDLMQAIALRIGTKQP